MSFKNVDTVHQERLRPASRLPHLRADLVGGPLLAVQGRDRHQVLAGANDGRPRQRVHHLQD